MKNEIRKVSIEKSFKNWQLKEHKNIYWNFNSLISSFLMIYLQKFISFAVDGVIMQTSSLPEYIRNSFYSDNVKSKLIRTCYLYVYNWYN